MFKQEEVIQGKFQATHKDTSKSLSLFHSICSFTFIMEVLEFPSLQPDSEQQKTLTEVSDDELNLPPSDDEEDAITEAKSKEVVEKEEAEEGDTGSGQMNGVMILALLDKIIGRVDQIQQTQVGLEARQQEMERSVTGIEGELTKLTKSHSTTANSVNKMLEKVRKVSVNVKTVRSNLEKQGSQIKRLESNENELLKRRNFKVMIYQVRIMKWYLELYVCINKSVFRCDSR